MIWCSIAGWRKHRWWCKKSSVVLELAYHVNYYHHFILTSKFPLYVCLVEFWKTYISETVHHKKRKRNEKWPTLWKLAVAVNTHPIYWAVEWLVGVDWRWSLWNCLLSFMHHLDLWSIMIILRKSSPIYGSKQDAEFQFK